MRILVTDGMDKTAMAQLRDMGHEVVEPLKQILKEQEIKTKTKKKEKEIRRKEREQEQINNGTDEVLTFQSPTPITE